VTPTWNVPAEGNVHDRVEVPEPVTLVGETVHEVLLVARLTTPAKPLSAVTVIVDVPTELATTVTLLWLAVIVKSCAWYVTVAE
jgi:hypothetical protein